MSVYQTREEKAINSAEYKCVRYINTRSLLPSACANVIRSHVASSQLMFRTEAGASVPMSMRFHRYIKDYLTAFIRDCIDEILTLGIIAVSYEVVRDKVDGTVLVAPYVIKGELGQKYVITVGPDNRRLGKLRYRFYRLIDEQGNSCQPAFDPSVHIFDGFGYDPMSDGRLRSVVSSIVWQERYISKMYFYALRSEQTRSAGTVYIESTQPITQASIGDTYFADGDQTTRQDEMYYVRTERELEENERARQMATVSIMSELLQTSNVGTDSVRDGVELFESVGANTTVPIIPLPDGRRIARANVQGGIDNWPGINKIYQDAVLTRYGVPREILFGDTPRATKDHATIVQGYFEKNISAYKRMIEQVLECVYNELFGDQDADYLFADTVVQFTRQRKQPTTTDSNDDKEPPTTNNNNNNPDNKSINTSYHSAVKTEPRHFLLETANTTTTTTTTTANLISAKNNKGIKRETKQQASQTGGLETDDARSQLIDFRKTLRSTVRQTGNVLEENLEETVDRLSRTAMPLLIKEINQLPDSVDIEDPVFSAYADRLLELIHERVRTNRVRISYVSMPNSNVEDLWELYKRGILPWNEYEQAVRAANNLPVHLSGTPEPWSTAQKAALMGIGETVGFGGGGNQSTTATTTAAATKSTKSNDKTKSSARKTPATKSTASDDDDDDEKDSDTDDVDKDKTKNKGAIKKKRTRDDDDSDSEYDDERDTAKASKRPKKSSKSKSSKVATSKKI